MDLETAIENFKLAHSHWNAQETAFYQCDTASNIFLEWLEKQGLKKAFQAEPYAFYINRYSDSRRWDRTLEPELQQPAGGPSRSNPDPKMYTGGSNEMGTPRADWHYIVETPECFIDWTARQYFADAPYPHIILKAPVPYWGA